MKKALAALLWAAWAWCQPAPIPDRPNPWTEQKERALGQQLASEIRRHEKLVEDPAILEYLDRIALKLSARSVPALRIEIALIASSEVNGFALPGGFLFLNTELVRDSGSEAELAGVLAHLIAFVEGRYFTRPAARGVLGNYAGVPLIFMGGQHGYSYRPANVLLPSGYLAASRAAVLACDERGLQLMWEAGYDPEEFIQGLEKLQRAEAGSPVRAVQTDLSTHPPASERITKARAVIDRLMAQNPRR